MKANRAGIALCLHILQLVLEHREHLLLGSHVFVVHRFLFFQLYLELFHRLLVVQSRLSVLNYDMKTACILMAVSSVDDVDHHKPALLIRSTPPSEVLINILSSVMRWVSPSDSVIRRTNMYCNLKHSVQGIIASLVPGVDQRIFFC